jgi:hypothetical protein
MCNCATKRHGFSVNMTSLGGQCEQRWLESRRDERRQPERMALAMLIEWSSIVAAMAAI